MAAKGIKGFSGLRIWPVTANTASTYAVGEKIDVPTAVSATTDRKSEDYELPADDGIYDSGSEFTSEDLEIIVQELPLDLEAKLDGASFDDETGVYSWGPETAVAPNYALGFRALKRDGTYRMIQYYYGKVTSIKIDYKTRTDNKDGSRHTIHMTMFPRLADGQHVRKKDTVTGSDLIWLNTVDAIPVGG